MQIDFTEFEKTEYGKAIEAFEKLAEKRKEHTIGVALTARQLAKVYGADSTKVTIASLCHDLFRGKTIEEINSWVKKYNLGDKYLGNANLAHGKIAEVYAKEELGIKDEEILRGISYHTTAKADMDLIEKIVFIADAIEPGRDYPGVEEIREMAFFDIDGACLKSLEGIIEHLLESGMKLEDIDIDTIEARDYLMEKERKN